MSHLFCRLLVVMILFIPIGASAQYTPDGEAYNRSVAAENVGDYRRALRELDTLTAPAKAQYMYQFRRAWLLHLSTQYEDSIEAYHKASSIAGPRAIEPLIGEMLPLMALRRWSDAMKVGTKVLGTSEQNTLVISRMAWCAYNLGRFKTAEAHYRQVLALFPSDLEMRSGLGWALLKQQKKKEATREFRAVLDIVPGHVGAQQGLAAVK